ncbi:MAG: MFS transporter [Desulfobacterales bacterium]|nr:MAG: MFS transporter [Desulfobacterales bacterium]
MDKAQKGKYIHSYVIAASCFCIQAVGIGVYVSYGVLINPLISEFGWPRASIAGASSVAFLLMGLLGIIVGRLNDRFGPRKLMTVGGAFFGLGYLLLSRLDTIWQLYLFFGVVFGIGLSSIDVIALSTIARWFVNKRGVVTGIVKVGTGAGQVIFPFLASIFITSYGWRNSCVIIGGVALVMLVSIAQLLRRDPSLMGLSSDWDKGNSTGTKDLADEGFSLREALRTWQFWTICASILTILFCLMTVLVHIVPFAQDIKVSPTKAAGVLSAIGGTSIAGRFISGIAIDRIGSKTVMIFGFILLIAGLLWLQIATALWMLYFFAVIYGIAHGGFFTVMSPIVAEFFGIKSHGALFGIVMFCGTFGGAVGPVLAGYIFDTTAEYAGAIWICTLMSALGFALISLLKPLAGSKTRSR